MTPPDFIAVGFAVLVILVAGMTVFYALEREPENYFPLERLAYCWPLGLSALGMPLFLMSLWGYRIHVAAVIGGVVAAALIVFALRRAPLGRFWRSPYKVGGRPERLTEFEWVLVAIIVACLGLRTLACCLTPMNDWDGVCTWGLKAKILFYGTLKSSMGYFRNAEYRCTNQAYPLLWPLTYAWICTVLGRWDDLAMGAVNPVNLMVFVTLLYFTLRKYNSRTVALSVSALAASLPSTMHYTECVQSDVPLMLISGAALFCLYNWMRHCRWGSILLAAVLMGGAMFTKEEGRLAFVAQCGGLALFVLTFRASTERKKLVGHWGAFVLVAGLWVLPWLLFRRTIPVWTQYFKPLGFSTLRWHDIPAFGNVMLACVLTLYNGVGLPKWNFLWPMMALFIVFSKSPWRSPWNWLLVIFLLHAVGISVIWLCSTVPFAPGVNEFAYERNLVVMLPPIWLVLAQCADEWWSVWKAPRETASPAKRQTA
jgi:hypothetical protein